MKVHYHGTLIDGTVFDSSVKRGEPATFPLGQVIKCWTEGVGMMKKGGKARWGAANPASLERIGLDSGTASGVMVGDSVYDVIAAGRIGIPTIAVRTGGFGVDELREAGATNVFDSIEELREGLSKTPFG